MQCFVFFFPNFLTEKKVSVFVSQHLMNPEWEKDKRSVEGGPAGLKQTTQLALANLQSTSSPLLPFSQTASPPLPTCSNIPTGKLHFNNPHAPPTVSIRVAAFFHTRITRILPGPLPPWYSSRGPHPGHTYLPASPPCANYFGVEQHDVHPTANIKLFFHHCKNYFLPFLHSSKLLSPFTFLSHIQKRSFKNLFNASNKHIFYSLGT